MAFRQGRKGDAARGHLAVHGLPLGYTRVLQSLLPEYGDRRTQFRRASLQICTTGSLGLPRKMQIMESQSAKSMESDSPRAVLAETSTRCVRKPVFKEHQSSYPQTPF